MPEMFQKLPDGSVQSVNVPAEKMAEARAAGFGVRKGSTFEVKDRTGVVHQVSDAELDRALDEGWKVRSDEEIQRDRLETEYGSIGEQAKLFAEKAAGAASLGLSDVALAELGGEEYRQARAAREKVNPLTSVAGEVTGAVAPLLLSGGASAAAKGAEGASLLARAGRLGAAGVRTVGAPTRAAAAVGAGTGEAVAKLLGRAGLTGESILGRSVLRGAEMAAGGAAEGAIYGAGQALSESALAPGGDYEGLGEKLLAGAKEGAILGGIMGGGIGGLTGAASRVGQKAVQKLQGAEGFQKWLSGFAEERTVKALGARGSDLKKLGESKARKMARDILEGHLDDGTKVFKAGEKADNLVEKVGKARKELGEKLGKIRKDVNEYIEATQKPELQPNLEGFFAKLDNLRAETEATGIPEMMTRARRLDRTFKPLRAKFEKGEAFKLEDLTKWRRTLDDMLDAKKAFTANAPPHFEELTKARRYLEDTITETTDKAVAQMDPKLAGRYQELKSKYASFADADTLVNKASLQDWGNRWASPSDYGAAIATASGTIARAEHLLTGGLGGLALGGATALAHKVIRERGASVVAVLANRTAKVDTKISTGVRTYLKKRPRQALSVITAETVRKDARQRTEAKQSKTDRALKRRSTETLEQAYTRTVKRAEQAQALASRTEIGSPAIPETSRAAAEVAKRGADYLLAHAPVKPREIDPHDLTPQLKDIKPDPVQLIEYGQRVQVVEDPTSVFDELEQGTLTPTHVDALRTVYPAIYEQMRTNVWDELTSAKEKPGYYQRIQLGTLLDVPADKSLEPQNIQATQTMYEQRLNQQPPPRQATPRASGKLARAMLSGSQRLEEGEEFS